MANVAKVLKLTDAGRGKKAEQAEGITIPRFDWRTIRLRVVGDTSLIVHRFDDKLLDVTRANGGAFGKPSRGKRPPRDPEAEYNQARYRIGKKDYFPGFTLKKCITQACQFVDDVRGSLIRSNVFILEDMMEIKGCKPRMDSRTVRVGGMNKVAMLRYRPIYEKWFFEITVRYNGGVINANNIVNLFQLAGQSCGLGELRPGKCGGNNGLFHVELMR